MIRRLSSTIVVVVVAVLAACNPAHSASPTAPSPTVTAGEPVATTPLDPSAPALGWIQIATSGDRPAAREDHTWTITPDGATAYLFGGRDGGTVHDDLWAYSLATDAWRALTPSGVTPPARFGHNAVWAPGIGLVIFAGQGASGFFGDLWSYDPVSNSWRSLPVAGAAPVSRYGSCATIGPDGRLWISHGFTSEGQRFSDTRAYDFANGTWTDETPLGSAPIRRCLHACWWTDDGSLRLYGGQTTTATALGDLWQLSVGERPGTNAWSQLRPAGGLPPERNLFAAARWDSRTIVFGGQDLDGSYLADAWWLADDGTAMSLAIGEGGPSPRAGAELIADAAGGRLILFGGRDSTSAFDELWQLIAPDLP